MASITLAGTLLDPNSDLSVGDEIRFTHTSTTGQTVKGAVSIITIGPSGSYSVNLQYGLVLVEYKDIRNTQFKNLGVATVNSSNPATTIPALLNALVPVSSAELIEFQAILADCVTAKDAAVVAAAGVTYGDLAQTYEFDTVALMTASLIIFPVGKVLETKGYYAKGDAGAARYLVVAAQAADEKGDHTLANATVALLQSAGTTNGRQFGATGDGVAVDTSPLLATYNSGNILTPDATAKYKTGQLSIGSDKVMFGTSLVGEAGSAQTLYTGGVSENVKLIGVTIDAVDGSGFQNNTANCKDIIITSSKITAGGYGILGNSSSGGTDGVIVANSVIESAVTDAIEWNHPLGTTKNFTAIGNLLTAGPTGVGTFGGFGVGVAGTDGHITALNHVRYSRLEAFHFEDEQHRGILALNTVEATDGEGVRVLYRAEAEPLVIVGNTIKHSGTKTNIAGLRFVNNVEGYLYENVIDNNIVDGFGIGYKFEGTGNQLLGVNLAVNCDTAVIMQGGGYISGTVVAKNCTNLISAKGTVERVISDTNNLTPLVKNGTAFPGPVLKSLNMPFTMAHTGSGAEQFIIMNTPDRLSGIITIRGGAGSTGVFYSTHATWDGATLTLTNTISRLSGVISSPSIIQNAGNIVFSVSKSASSTYEMSYDFEGVHYIH